MLRPLRDRILVERLEGHGIERVSPGGIIIPAICEKNVQTKSDTFRARVLAIGPEADRELQGDLKPGDEVLLYTFDGHPDRVFTGDLGGESGLFVRPDDILCAVEGT